MALNMNDLIKTLEAAEEGSRELDETIAIGIGQKTRSYIGLGEEEIFQFDKHVKHASWWETLPHYTTSIDAALTLLDRLPRKAHWSVAWPVAQVELIFSGGPLIKIDAGTPPIAICMAFLEARKVLVDA